MAYPSLNKYLEILIVGVLACLLLTPVIMSKLDLGGALPVCPDHWLSCFTLEHQITRLLGKNPGEIWDGGYFFPFHKVSLLFNEPTWGVSLAVLPLWVIVGDIFFINNFGGIPALILSWIGVYGFARALGSARIYAFFAALTFCLSGVSLALIADVYFFWPFFLIPCLGWLVIKIFKSSNITWGILFGIGYGYLAWSSAHLAVMGGCLLLLFGLWQLWLNGVPKNRRFSLLCAFFIAVLIASPLYGPMYMVHKQFGRVSLRPEQFQHATNWANLIYSHMQWNRPWHFLSSFPFWKNFHNYAKGETPIGLSLILLLLSAWFFLLLLCRANTTKRYNSRYLKVIFFYSFPVLLAFLHILILKQLLRPIPLMQVDTIKTLLYYCVFGSIVVYLRNKITMALRQPSFFFLVLAIFMAFLAFGPYYLIGNGRLIPSPTIIFSCFVPGFSGIRASARWGLMLSFSLSLGVALALSECKVNFAKRILIPILIFLSFLELFPGFYWGSIPALNLHQWKPRKVDVFLRNITQKGAVFELSSYPLSYSSVGPDMYSSLYHKRPIITGYATVVPRVTEDYLYTSERKLTQKVISQLRKFGAKYWVFHMGKWPKEDNFYPGEHIGGLKRIASLDGGKTLVYEDPALCVSVDKLSLE